MDPKKIFRGCRRFGGQKYFLQKALKDAGYGIWGEGDWTAILDNFPKERCNPCCSALQFRPNPKTPNGETLATIPRIVLQGDREGDPEIDGGDRPGIGRMMGGDAEIEDKTLEAGLSEGERGVLYSFPPRAPAGFFFYEFLANFVQFETKRNLCVFCQ